MEANFARGQYETRQTRAEIAEFGTGTLIGFGLPRNGEPGGTRTRDHRIKSAMLYQLSYRPILLQKQLLITASSLFGALSDPAV